VSAKTAKWEIPWRWPLSKNYFIRIFLTMKTFILHELLKIKTSKQCKNSKQHIRLAIYHTLTGAAQQFIRIV